ncbi:gamma-glutamyl-gamma-aminobutyrate hydrolase family protein [Niallia endozanthoxylica]|uniref:Gamma-glutamyl-gamma-aminobutyrate hydrolase family protein n=1 Tax=Niallia endozanthoxylica TaxID=2036016 RepID=A0A5J5HVX8_9BACI|nr:gamma-glutamyl-gamma-aminobutyrate hydrolase family protein [Niallia endozanthoxylica]KAA9026983.1 gamma-glutamyl-gamma-aminobutyrate hydrolase family protein [Niallia endozanthoxylica]
MNKGIVGFIGRQDWLNNASPPLPITFVPTSLLTFFQKLGYETVIIDIDNEVDILNRLDVLVLNGGFEDIDPSLYGEDRHPLTADCNKEMDLFEIQAVQFAIKRKIPVLGICRGFQLINVALGGTLHQELSELGSGIAHISDSYSKPVHSVKIRGWMKELLGERIEVNSYHHQGIDQLADALNPLAWAEDGLVEAYELKDDSVPLFAVQWHPELLVDDNSFKLIEAYLKRCKEFQEIVANEG